MQSYSHLYETYQVSCSPAGKRTPSYFLTQSSLQCTNHGVNLFFLRIIVFVYFIKFFFFSYFVFLRGADDLLPILTFVALRSETPQLVSECAALEEFIHEGCVFNIKCRVIFLFSASMNWKWAMGSCVKLWEGPLCMCLPPGHVLWLSFVKSFSFYI